MAVVASDRLTLATLASPTYVRTFYLKQSSTLNPPGVPTANPPGGNWSTTEPTFSPNETATVYTVMLTAYGPNRNDYGPVQKSTSYEAAKQAYNQAVSAGNSADDAYQKALDAQNDLANLQIGGRNLFQAAGGEYLSLQWVSPAYNPELVVEDGKRAIAFGSSNNIFSVGRRGAPVIPAGETITLSFWGKGSREMTLPRVYLGPGAGNIRYLGSADAVVPTEWKQFVVTYETISELTVALHMYPTISNGDGTYDTFYLSDMKLERGSKATDWTPAPEDVDASITDARTKAENALADLATRPTKAYVDDQVLTSANGKNSITTSLNAPSGSGINGDLWRRHDSSGHVYQEFTWRDGGWKPTMVTSEMVTNMDIHKLTVSGDATFTTAVADEIWSEVVRARLVVATELIAGDAIVKNSLSADRLKAKTITAESGVIDDLAIKEAHIGNASVTNAKIKNLDAAKITSGYIDAARIESRTIAAEKLLLGSFDNFFHDPRFEDPRGYSPGVVVGETLRLNAGHTVNASWLAMPVDKDESYNVRFRKTGTGNLTFAIHSATTPSGPYSLLGDSFNTDTEEGDFGFTVTADKPYIRWVASNTTAQSFISDIKIQKVFTGIRLEDGIVTTEKIQSGAVVADSISADSITSEHMGANSVTAQSIGANQITGDHISAGSITGEHIEAESISAGNIGAEAITTEKLHAGAVTYEKIELGAVRGDNLGDISKEQFMNAVDGDLSNIIDSAETIADSIVISPGEIRLTTETTTGNDGVARNYLSLPASFTGSTLYDGHYNFSASQGSTITVSITLRADKPNSRFNFDLTRRGETLKVISNALVPTEWTTITGTAIAPLTDNYYIDLFMFNISTGTQRAAAIDIAEVRIQGAIPNGNFDNGDLHWNLPTGAEIKSLGTKTNETALSLTSTRQTFIVDGKDVVYIDSEEESMNIKNVVVHDSIRVGNHIIEKISDDITAFMWAGDRQ